LFLYLDEDLASKELIARLAKSGHFVVDTVRGIGDAVAWATAQEHGAAVLTQNAPDFLKLASEAKSHHGLLVVYRDGNASKDMRIAEIAAAVDKVQAELGIGLKDQIVILNQYR